MATLAEFFPYLLPLVPGCPQPLAEMMLRQTAIDFCTHAPIVQEVLDPIDVVAGQARYDIDTAFGSNVTLILEARLNGLAMAVAKLGDADYASHLQDEAAYRIMQSADNTFSLDPVPTVDAPGAIALTIATRPVRSATSFADVLLDYVYEIGAGTAARLMLMPGQLFTNPQLAAAYQAIYLSARVDARIRADRSFGRAATTVRPRRFA